MPPSTPAHLLVEDWLGLATVAGLLAVVPPLTCSETCAGIQEHDTSRSRVHKSTKLNFRCRFDAALTADVLSRHAICAADAS